MKESKLQLLIYGKNISQYQPEMSGVNIVEVTRTENPNYLFVTIDTEGLTAGMYDFNLNKGKKKVATYSYELKQRLSESALRKGFDSSDVVYLLMPDRFANGNVENDNTKDTAEKANRDLHGGRHGGDLDGIIKHLDYLEELGVTAIWSTPLLEDNEPVYSYHGYAQSNYYKIDPRFGTNEDYKRLANELHNRNMKLIMDYVTNHWGSKHWLIRDLPSKDWIHYWANNETGFKRSNYRMTTQFDVNAATIDAIACMDGWFDTTMPDMNQKNPMVVNYMVQNAIWWIEFAGLDGLRVDTYSYNDKYGIAQWTKRIMEEYPNFNIVGEVWMHDQAQISYWQKDSKISAIEGYNSYLPSVMDFTLHDAILQAFDEDDQGWDKGMIRVYENFTNDFLYPDINNMLVFASNHDTQRLYTIFDGDVNKYKLAMTLIATIRGIPQIYYGDEIGMQGNKTLGDGDIRRDFPGGWPSDEQNAFVEAGRNENIKSYFDFTKKLLNWRKRSEVIHFGKTTHYVPQANVYVYFRYTDEKTVMIVINNNKEVQTFSLDRFSQRLGTATRGYEIFSDTTVDLTKLFSIPGKTPMIIEIENN